ncbi:thiopeptide-type bacteriocin biosynthesis protein [Jidongwangia harbinensis]|uniref:thiopeptide-type bacteriocin biosynthesis protein n=1 Tax=Jidongwangia harbinensis TaxID=2878561 RepID=UPI001CDA0E03|nr:thiopeptide-type bacteriocin biosynthesis protein [Jidongwangia harbinensis]MCA2215059.1 thiopeptide-type bacteriocin biosynthesis protein [Jidongwangia harbinensis]
MPTSKIASAGPAGLPLPQFLRECARAAADDGTAPDDGDLARACRVFVDAGLAGLRRDRDATDWLQYDLSFGPGGRHPVYPALLAAVRDLLAADRIDDFFFMHKPPGLRVRFHPAPGTRPAVADAVRRHVLDWQGAGLIRDWRPACYEPEVRLFGGPVSMRSVHRMFTADSLVWLAYHGTAAAPGGSPGPDWALSLLMLRTAFDALRIVGWEDLDVWDRVRWQTGRRLGPDVTGRLDLEPLTATLRAGWVATGQMLGLVRPELRQAVADYRATVAAEGDRWLREYFHTDAAELGPRAALAYLIIFHWNRAALPITRQSVLTEAMAAHSARPAR